ncbi:aldo/keto reductase [Embleya scabrispora]|uniref:aldo/keto reductase n=1 Tax=Embleya scabrispora TaxID=159449 RepID=UPI00068EACA8|nr:aldo/keto reductase [Embleya scabrispora]MYS87755.1 aldo/keto reductase [Streptomyces sp. SID5474]
MTDTGVSHRLALPPRGLGTASLGTQTDRSRDVLTAAWEAGIRYFDTAPHYGVGSAERRLGAFLASQPRQDFLVSTKVGRLLLPPHQAGGRPIEPGRAPDGSGLVRVRDHSRAGIEQSLTHSLERLGLDRVDLALLHDPDDYLDEAVETAIPALTELRAQGLVSAIGVGMNQTPGLRRLVAETEIDYVLVAGRYTLLDQVAAESLLPLCRSRGVKVIAGAVLNSGLLADPDRNEVFDYQPVRPEVLIAARRLADICDRHGERLLTAALQFPSRNPLVENTLLGAGSAQEVKELTTLVERRLPDLLWAELDAAAQEMQPALASGRWR